MKLPLIFALFLSVSILLVQAADDSAADQIFRRADANGDGKVTPDELSNEKTFARFDLNKDGSITTDESRKVLGEMAQAGTLNRSGSGDASAGQSAGTGRSRAGDFIRKLLDRRLSLRAKSFRLKELVRDNNMEMLMKKVKVLRTVIFICTQAGLQKGEGSEANL